MGVSHMQYLNKMAVSHMQYLNKMAVSHMQYLAAADTAIYKGVGTRNHRCNAGSVYAVITKTDKSVQRTQRSKGNEPNLMFSTVQHCTVLYIHWQNKEHRAETVERTIPGWECLEQTVYAQDISILFKQHKLQN
jgi:hypothetical protein